MRAATGNSPREAAAWRLSPEALDAWRLSVFGSEVPAETAELLEAGSERIIGAGEHVNRLELSVEQVLFVTIDGVLRIYSARRQREVTVGYRMAGDVFGIPTLFAPAIRGERISLDAVAMTDSRVLLLSSRKLFKLVDRSPTVRGVVFDQMAKAFMEGYELLTEGVFLSVRQRVSRCLLDLAVRSDGELRVHLRQQEIADTIGSVRTVVSRTISGFCAEGLIRREGDFYVLLDPGRLHRVAADQ